MARASHQTLSHAILIVLVAIVIVLGGVFALARATRDDNAYSHGLQPLLWTGLATAVAGIVASAILTRRAERRRVKDTAALFLRALLPDAEVLPRLQNRSDNAVLDDLADALAALMTQAAKDQAQLRTIISSMSDGLVALDHQQRLLIANDAARDLLQFRQDNAIDKQWWEVVPLDDVLRAVTEVSLTGQRKTLSIGPVAGRFLDVTVTRLPLRPAGFIIVARDVTEARRYEELRREFVANVSHELRTPLSVIKGYIETLRDGTLDDRERAARYLDTVGRHTEQLALLVDDLLSLSRLDGAADVPSPRPVEIDRVVARAVESLRPAAEKKAQTLTLDIDAASHPIIGSQQYLERAVSNLLDNAIKYTPENGQIRVSLRADTDHAIIEVADNGIGIPTDDLPRIFERFYRVDRSRSRDMGGTGLGLSIVKHVAQTHGGSVEVESTPGEGSTFRIKIPLAAAAA